MAINKNKDISKFVVTQSNDLVEANYSPELTTHAHKIARLILSLISPDDKNLRTYTISINALKQYLGINPNTRWGAFYDRLKETAKKLNKKPIELKHKNGDSTVAYFISGYTLSPKKGTITFEISSLLKPFLLELKQNYTSYLLANIPKLKSSYSIRIYELLHQYRKIGKRSFELDNLQKKVGSNYNLYGDFKRKVLKQAQKDLKLYTDINFIFAEIKTGRKVTSIDFVIFGNIPKEKEAPQLSLLENAFDISENKEPPALSDEIIKRINALGVNEQNISKYLATGFEIIKDEKAREKAKERCKNLNNYYLEKLELTKLSNTKNNPAGFFIKSLKEDWQNSKSIKQKKNKEASQNLREAKKQLVKLNKQEEFLKERYENHRNNILKEIIETDEVTFHQVYKEVIDTKFKGITRSILKPNLSAKQQYDQSSMVSSMVNIELQKTFSEKFEKLENWYVSKINPIKIEITKLKKENPLIKY